MDAFWRFVDDNINEPPDRLRLKYHGKQMPFDIDLAITQIECRSKFGKKFAETLSRDRRWLFASVLAGEQATSDLLARYHASLCGGAGRIADLTAGLGIDAVHLAAEADVTAVEIDIDKANALIYNRDTLQLDNLKVVNDDCRNFLEATTGRYDMVFIDPARRAEGGGRIFALADCHPDVIAMLPDIKRVTSRLIVKMSPMLDISSVLTALGGVRRIISLGTPTECKELIADVRFDTDEMSTHISAVTLRADEVSEFTFTPADERAARLTIAEPRRLTSYRYLYEPYPTVMKAAPSRLLSERYGIDKIAANTNLYLSDEIKTGFPGDIWQIEKVLTFESKHIKRIKKEYPRLMVTARNFAYTSDRLRAKLGVADGGDRRLFAVTATDDSKYMIIVRR